MCLEPLVEVFAGVLMSHLKTADRHLVTLSPCHLVTLSPCHLVTLSPCHLVTLSPCHLVTLSPCHLVTPLRFGELGVINPLVVFYFRNDGFHDFRAVAE